MKHEVFVEVNMNLHTESNQRAALIAKLDTGAQGTLFAHHIVHYVSSYVSSKLSSGWTSKVRTLYTDIQLMMVLSLCNVEHVGSNVNS